jgi:hypothetical protein
MLFQKEMICCFFLKKFITNILKKLSYNEISDQKWMLKCNNNQKIMVMTILKRGNNKSLNNNIACIESNGCIDNNCSEWNLFKHANKLADSNRYFRQASLLILEFTHYWFHCYHVTNEAYQRCQRKYRTEQCYVSELHYYVVLTFSYWPFFVFLKAIIEFNLILYFKTLLWDFIFFPSFFPFIF